MKVIDLLMLPIVNIILLSTFLGHSSLSSSSNSIISQISFSSADNCELTDVRLISVTLYLFGQKAAALDHSSGHQRSLTRSICVFYDRRLAWQTDCHVTCVWLDELLIVRLCRVTVYEIRYRLWFVSRSKFEFSCVTAPSTSKSKTLIIILPGCLITFIQWLDVDVLQIQLVKSR